MKKMLLIVVLFIVLYLCFYTGSKERLMKTEISDNSLNVIDLITKKYSDSDLKYMSSLDYTLKEQDKNYSIECLRKINDGDYKAIYRSEDQFLFVIFDKKGNKKFSHVVAASPNKEEFETLKNGSYILEVKKVDSTQEYNVGNISSSSSSKLTRHFTKDGFQVTIFYDKNFNISEVKYELL